MPYTWVPFYRELCQRVLEFENKQDELLVTLRMMKEETSRCVPLEDNQPKGPPKPLSVMDPFTFMANFARVEDQTARKLCGWFREQWKIEAYVPDDFHGRAGIVARGGRSWFFGSVQSGRQPEDVGRLWQLAKQAYSGSLDEIDFQLLQRCLRQDNLTLRKLTVGLSWFNPKHFLPLNNRMISYLKSQEVPLNGSSINQRDAKEYVKATRYAKRLDPDFLALAARVLDGQSDLKDEEEPEHFMLNPSSPLNRILYGPPGTGKTYSVVDEALEIIDGPTLEDHKERQDRFKELLSQGRIGFVTFHQSFSYEEFIEGLRPIIDNEDGQARYEVRAGILKQMAFDAMSSSVAFSGSFGDAWELLLEEFEGEETVVDLGEAGEFEGQLDGSQIVGRKRGGRSSAFSLQCEKATAESVWEHTIRKKAADRADVRHRVGQSGVQADFVAAVVNTIRDVVHSKPQDSVLSWLDGDPNFSLWDGEVDRYVLIIDEINRGNISKILGELITLLEDDKRLGAANELRLTLPVSGETFALPPNLYILGTMNTADKSLAQLDVALRRRFVFTELAPDFSLCKQLPKEMQTVLKELNDRIEWAIDREHRLGHAHFMGVSTADQFDEVWENKIMPLLVELFADNLQTLREVLGDGERKDGFVRAFAPPSGMKGRERLRLYRDCDDAPTLSAWETLRKNLGS